MIRRVFFDLRYLLGRTPWDSGTTPPELVAYLDEVPPGRALDLGCGTGTNAIHLARRGWHVVGVDLSNRAIRMAQRKANAVGVSIDLRHGDVTQLTNVQGPFDLALDIGCYHSLTPMGRVRYTANLRDLVRPGGTFLLYSWVCPEGNRDSLSEADTRAAFGKDFDLRTIAHGSDRHRKAAWFTFHRKA